MLLWLLANKPPKKREEPEAAPVVDPAPQQAEQSAPAPEQPVVEATKGRETPAPAPVVDKVEVKELDGNAGDPVAEKKARVFLDDATPADHLDDEALRARLMACAT